jgi:hypothetical protein
MLKVRENKTFILTDNREQFCKGQMGTIKNTNGNHSLTIVPIHLSCLISQAPGYGYCGRQCSFCEVGTLPNAHQFNFLRYKLLSSPFGFPDYLPGRSVISVLPAIPEGISRVHKACSGLTRFNLCSMARNGLTH